MESRSTGVQLQEHAQGLLCSSGTQMAVGIGMLTSALWMSSESSAWAQEQLLNSSSSGYLPDQDHLNQIATVAEFEGFWANAAR